ncbi:MAG: hypothetical protein WBM24_25895 [Candidatus Sulfotelmatobacter sp.]
MLNFKKLLSIVSLFVVTAMPAMAGTNDANPTNAKAPNAEATPAAASPSLAAASSATTNAAAQPSASALAAEESSTASSSSSSAQGQQPPAATTQQTPQHEKPIPVAVVPAIAPVRVIPVDPPVKDGLVPAFKMGGVKMTPYGFIKATAAHDSSAPNGDDFPFIGLFTATTSETNTGPTADPEFHIKARSTRFGANFEWPDISPRLTFTGRIEGDFEGNFSVVDNRNVSSIRSNEPQLRLAYVRMDFAASSATDFFFEGGQDWTLFGSSALPNILETTFLGAYYGDVYERSPQMMVGLVQKLAGSFKIAPTFAIMMPSSAQVERTSGTVAGLAQQLGQGEREGADSDRPEYEGRLALQWQLDKAPGVAPAQVLWSGFYGKRTSIVTSSDYGTTVLPTGCVTGTPPAINALCASYIAALPNGYSASSDMYGDQVAVQLPTRWFTFVASAYFGGDLRFMFGGQANSFSTDLTGLSNPIKFDTIDGLGNAAVGCRVAVAAGGGCPAGDVEVAPERPIRAFGGFANLGLPISRWFNANPKGHNAGWQLFLHMGKDQMVHRELTNPNFTGANPLLMGKVFAATLYYKVNPYCTFAIEQSVYGTRLKPGESYTIAGHLDNLWQDHRTEFGPVFTF